MEEILYLHQQVADSKRNFVDLSLVAWSMAIAATAVVVVVVPAIIVSLGVDDECWVITV